MHPLGLRISLLFIALLFSHLAYGQADWPVLKNTEYKFRLAYPPNWQVVTADTPYSIGAVASPKGKYVGVCSVWIKPAPQTGAKTQEQLNKEMNTFEMLPGHWMRQLEGTFPDVKILETSKVKIQNQPAYSATAEASYESLDDKSFVHNIFITTLTPGFVWNLTCGTLASSALDARNGFDYWQPTFMAILRTFFIEQ